MDNTGLLPLVVEDFSGGMTDFILGGATNKAEVMDNFIVNENNDCVVRPGSDMKYDERISASGTIRNIIDNQDEILLQQNKSVVFVDNDGVHEILSSQDHSVFVGGDDDINAEFSYWNKHTLGVSDVLKSPQKIYKDANGDWQVSTLGLPEILYATSIGLANRIKTQYNTHRASTDQHLVADSTNVVTAADASDLGSLFTLRDQLKDKIQAHFDDAALGTPIYHTATVDRDLADDDAETVFSTYDSLVALKNSYNLHEDGDSTHSVEGSYQVEDSYLEPAASGAAGAKSYVVGMHFTYRYNVGEFEFLERGPMHLIEVDDVDSASGSIVVHKIPTLASGENENWDDSNVKVSIYRTVGDGTTLFFEKEVDNGTTLVELTATDDELQLNATAYTEGGVLNDEMPQPAKFIQTVSDFTFFAGIQDGRVFRGNRLKATKPGAPYSSPSDYYLDFEDDFTGLGKVGIYPVAFLRDKFYRVEGSLDSLGRGSMDKRSISQKIGCISSKSIVQTKDGLFFAGADGFYFTDGFNYRKISHDINLTFKALYNKDKICGCYDPLRNRILWGVQVEELSDSNDKVFVAMLDYRTEYGGHPFVSWSGGRDADNFSASALAYIDGELLRADHRGYLLYHDEDILTDPYIDTDLDPTNFYTQTIFYDYTSIAFDFNNPQVRKWISKLNVNADNQTSLSLNIETSNDRSGVYVELKPILKKLNPEWGDPSIVWGSDEAPRWNYNPVINEWRWMNAVEQNLRCMYKQVKFTNAYAEIDNSSDAGPASIDASSTEVTLLTGDWISDPVNYYISFDTDGYVEQYKILGITGQVLTVEDNDGTLADTASAEWKIFGYKKREIFNLLSYVLNYKIISMTQDTYRATQE